MIVITTLSLIDYD